MLLKEKESGDLVKIVDVDALIIPTRKEVAGCIQAGQEEQDPTNFDKNQLVFPSGETLPRCWVDAEYQSS
ncbi:acetyltransferase [Ancylothrix sp. C2]|uniref:acetyltransferase n=1 Tax=Ancylothrix sp. D3o TaxID=2953691 RepID=UPI0021BAAFBB|nr:acetyltransferase [Ancylothrix sp. D3o]MCT7950691.1 acetyltransferase [Ancylothrix sp. D3o]